MALKKDDRLRLKWLSLHGPAWGGHIERKEPLTNPDLKAWLQAGLIKLDASGIGYVLTEKGHRAIE